MSLPMSSSLTLSQIFPEPYQNEMVMEELGNNTNLGGRTGLKPFRKDEDTHFYRCYCSIIDKLRIT